ncbi:MAG: T9SS type A sorting domain-containing protein [Flavobacterium sp.]|nr:MAG: T9SS type A sorting domain-containing protein [Flavobacterium sp.]
MTKKILLTFCISLLLLTSAANAADGQLLPPPTTQVQSSQCGQVLPALNANIYANVVAGASYYMFKVSCTLPSGLPQVQTLVSALRVFNLTQLGSYAFSRTYTVEVSVNYGGVWQPYGPACTVISPTPVTTIQSAQCGITMVSLNDPIYANAVTSAPGYRFRITNVADASQVYIVDRALRDLRLTNFPVSSGATYTVEVAVKNYDGTFLPYGMVCSITAPVLITKLQSAFCGRVMTSLTEYLYADDIQGATGYRFKITNMASGAVALIDRPLRTFTMSLIPNLTYSTAYRVEVAIKDPQGLYLSYGPFCTVFTQTLPTPKMQLSQCEMACTSVTEMMYADDYANATTYRFRLINTELGYSQYVDRPSRCYNLNMFSGLQPGTAYTVKVAVKINGVFTAYGKACDVTTPPSLPATRHSISFNENTESDTSLMPKPYPNPFTDYFSIDATLRADAEVSVKVFDMMGRLLDAHNVYGKDLPALQFGSNYPPGVYNVVVQLNDQVQTMRVIKR